MNSFIMSGHDAEFLKQCVGDALSRGVAAVAAARPSDPVEFLGRWLHEYVKNGEVEDKFLLEKAADAENMRADMAITLGKEKAVSAAKTEREDALRQVCDFFSHSEIG